MSKQIPYVLLSYQRKWTGDESPVKIIEKSRRIGLSWCESADDVLFAAQKDGGDDVWYIGYNKDMAEEFIGDCADWVEKFGKQAGKVQEEIIKDGDKDILTFRIRFSSGNKIVALSSRPSNLRGKQGRVVIDEAAFHDDLKELLKAAMALLIWGGQVRVISTHDGESNVFNELIKDVRAGRKPYSLHRVTFDDALKAGLYKRICLIKEQPWSFEAEAVWRQEMIDFYGDTADEELFCIPSQGTGAFLTRALIEQCMSKDIPVLRYAVDDDFKFLDEDIRFFQAQAWCEDFVAPLLAELDNSRRSYLGEDFGRSGDLTVLIPLQEQQNTTFKAPFVLELRNMPFKQQEQIVFYIIDNLPVFTHGAFDARGNGQYLAEVAAQKYGESRISEVMLSESWYRENMPRYKAAFEDKTILLPLDADIIEDHRAFKLIKGVGRLPTGKTNAGGKKKEQRHGDAGVAGAMAWYATSQDGGGDTEILSDIPLETADMFAGY